LSIFNSYFFLLDSLRLVYVSNLEEHLFQHTPLVDVDLILDSTRSCQVRSQNHHK